MKAWGFLVYHLAYVHKAHSFFFFPREKKYLFILHSKRWDWYQFSIFSASTLRNKIHVDLPFSLDWMNGICVVKPDSTEFFVYSRFSKQVISNLCFKIFFSLILRYMKKCWCLTIQPICIVWWNESQIFLRANEL